MKFTFTKSRAKYILTAILLLLTIIGFSLSLFDIILNKAIILPILILFSLLLLALMLFKIEFSNKINKIITVSATLIFPFISMWCVELMQKSLHMATFKAYITNYCIYLAGYLFFTAVTTRFKYAVMVMAPLSTLIGAINHYVLAFRGSVMQPWDIAAAQTAMNVINNFIFTLDEYVLIPLLITIIMILIACNLKPIERSKKRKYISLGVLLTVMVISVIIPTAMITDNNGKFERDLWNQTVSSKHNGYVVNFLLNLQLMNNEAPENYSTESINEILTEYTSDNISGDENTPNIIVIMNEAFADLESVEDFGLAEDCLPFYHSLSAADNTVTGTLNVSVFGGGTCNTEYEFLTSNVCDMLRSGSYPMQQFVNSESVSIASNLKQLGYKTVGVHPYYGSGWNRSRSYPLLGIDEFITIDDFDENTEKIREYVSDSACYERIIDIYEQSEEPLFLFSVTMQNHGGYETAWDNMPNNINFTNDNTYQQTDRYLELVKLSDDALKELIEYFTVQEEETIILVFGDHQPSLGSEYAEIFKSTTNSDLVNASKKYTVPFFIWANFDIEKEQIENISPNYLAPLLLEKAAMPQTAYYKYLNDLRDDLQTITAITCIDKNKNYFTILNATDESAEKLAEYKMLQYNNVFDSNNLVTNKFIYDTN